MFKFKELNQKELKTSVTNTSFKLHISDAALEKDYWVCFVLNYIFHKCKWKNAFTFKGGTSLSKCYNLINRFSEDIDLILDWRVIGYGVEEPWEQRSNNKQDKFNKTSNEKTADFIKNELVPTMQKDFEEMIFEDFEIITDDKDPQTVLFAYPKNFTSPYITPTIKLEIGALAAWSPSENINIVPELYKVYPSLFEGQGISVRTVLPARTFWEKATILHHEANRPNNLNIPPRYARHYYDLYCIANSMHKDLAFAEHNLLQEVVKFKQKFYPRNWAQYDKATINQIRLIPDEYRFIEIEQDYEEMKDMFIGQAPSFEEVMNKIRELEKEIHSIVK